MDLEEAEKFLATCDRSAAPPPQVRSGHGWVTWLKDGQQVAYGHFTGLIATVTISSVDENPVQSFEGPAARHLKYHGNNIPDSQEES